jgi:hypothetical protein
MQNEKMTTCRQNGKAPRDNQQDVKVRKQNDYAIKTNKIKAHDILNVGAGECGL